MWSSKKKPNAGSLDITPLVDLVFLLIIFFLLSTTFIVSPGIRIDLPETISQKIRKEPKEITLSVDHTCAVYVNKELVDLDLLVTRLVGIARENPDTTVFIRGDRNAGFGCVADILGMVKHAGLHRIAIMTQTKKHHSEQYEKNGQGLVTVRYP